MVRIEIFLARSHRSYKPDNIDNPYAWRPTEKDIQLIKWLDENLGKNNRGEYRLPLRGEGWFICEGYNEDQHLDDYSWRKLAGASYSPKGKLGIWLEIEDDAQAALLKLSGILDHRQKINSYV